MGGRIWPLRLEVARLRVGSGSAFLGEVKRAGPQQGERDSEDPFHATTDSSIKQHYSIAFCALKHTRSSYKPALFYVDSGLSFGASSEV